MPNTQKRSISETLRTNCYLSILVVVILAIYNQLEIAITDTTK